MASIALLPALAACSASTPADYATGVYPSQSIGDALKGSLESPPPAPAARPPAPPNSSSAVAGQPGRTAPSGSATAPAPARPAPPDDSDVAASAYPSVSLSDLLFGPPKPAPR